MKPKSSPLHFLDYAVTRFDFEFNISKEDTDVIEQFEKYPLEIDFHVFKNDQLKVFMDVEVNTEEPKLPGYSIKAEVACIFQLDENAELQVSQIQEIESFSIIYIALNSLRGIVSNFTANAPFGRYLIPSIDLNDLIEQKRQSLTTAAQPAALKGQAAPLKKPIPKQNKIKVKNKKNA